MQKVAVWLICLILSQIYFTTYSQNSKSEIKAKSEFEKALKYLNKGDLSNSTKYFILSKNSPTYIEESSNLLGIISVKKNLYPMSRNRFENAFSVSNNYHYLYNQILTDLGAGELNLAYDDFKKINFSSLGFNAKHNYGICLAKLDSTSISENIFKSTYKESKSAPKDFFYNYSIVLSKKGDFNSAFNVYNKHLKSIKNNRFNYLKTILELNNGVPKVKIPNQVNDGEINFFLKGYNYLNDSNYTKVHQLMDNAYGRNLNNYFAILNRIQVNIISNNLDGANLFLEKYKSKFYNSFELKNIEAWMFLQKNDFQSANKLFNESLNENPNPGALYGLFILNLRWENYENSTFFFERLQNQFPYFFLDGRDYFSYGYALLVSSNSILGDESIKRLKKFSKCLFYQYLALKEIKNDNKDLAINLFEKAYQSSNSTKEKSLIYLNLGILYYELSQFENSKDYFFKSKNISPSVANITGLSFSSFKLGDQEKGLNYSSKAIELDTNNYLLKLNEASFLKLFALSKNEKKDTLLQQVLGIEKNVLNQHGDSSIGLNIGMTYYYLAKIDSSKYFFKMGKRDTLSFYNNYGILMSFSNKKDSSIVLLKKSLSIGKANKEVRFSQTIKQNLDNILKKETLQSQDFSFFYCYYFPDYVDAYLAQTSQIRMKYFFPYPNFSDFTYDFRIEKNRSLKRIKLKGLNQSIVEFNEF